MSWLDAQGSQAWQQARQDGRAAVVRLPYPPTANNLFAPAPRRSKRTGLMVLSKRKTAEARNYAEEVWYHVRIQKMRRGITGPVVVLIWATPPPDNRRRDAMNLEKAVTDSLVAAEVLADDSQVKDFRIAWAYSAYHAEPVATGVEVSIRELLPHELSITPTAKKTAARARC